MLVGLVLLLTAAAAPVLEALAPCTEPCVDEGPGGQCATGPCCSCCVHVRLVKVDRLALVAPLAPAFPLPPTAVGMALAADPRDILHVPKPTRA